MDGIIGEIINAKRILPPEHLPRADRVEDLELVGREAFGVDEGLAFDLGLGGGLGVGGGGLGGLDGGGGDGGEGGLRGGGLGGQHGGFDLLHDGGLAVGRVLLEGVEAEFDGFGDFFLAEFGADVGGALDDWRIVVG